jgi:hypothetical protein
MVNSRDNTGGKREMLPTVFIGPVPWFDEEVGPNLPNIELASTYHVPAISIIVMHGPSPRERTCRD